MKAKPKIQNRSTKHDETIKAIPLACADEKAAVEFMEKKRWGDTPSCPRCGGINPYQMKDSKTGERQANFRWRCHDCKAQYTVRIGTVFEDSRIPLRHWCYGFWRAATSKKGVSALEIHRHTGLSYKSALFMLNRIRFAKAKAEAFLNVPLYRAVYDKYRGHVLPPAAALERDMASLGVAEKQKDKARWAFERSAEQAAFFEHGKNRLVEPSIRDTGESHINEDDDAAFHGGGGNSGNGSGGAVGSSNGGSDSAEHGDTGTDKKVDPVIRGLVSRLPKADTSWPYAQRVKWLQTMANAFGLIYKDDGKEGEISVSLRSGNHDR